jgi:hypothetical protein
MARAGSLANRCHAVSHGFLKTWQSHPVSTQHPLFVTVGNVHFRGEDIYGLTPDKLRAILAEGRKPRHNLDFHVWLTWADMTVFDLSILPSLAAMGRLAPGEASAGVVVWREDQPGDFHFEPLLVDNDFFLKVDTGSTIIHTGS